jgi:hypothetical protein
MRRQQVGQPSLCDRGRLLRFATYRAQKNLWKFGRGQLSRHSHYALALGDDRGFDVGLLNNDSCIDNRYRLARFGQNHGVGSLAPELALLPLVPPPTLVQVAA